MICFLRFPALCVFVTFEILLTVWVCICVCGACPRACLHNAVCCSTAGFFCCCCCLSVVWGAGERWEKGVDKLPSLLSHIDRIPSRRTHKRTAHHWRRGRGEQASANTVQHILLCTRIRKQMLVVNIRLSKKAQSCNSFKSFGFPVMPVCCELRIREICRR